MELFSKEKLSYNQKVMVIPWLPHLFSYKTGFPLSRLTPDISLLRNPLIRWVFTFQNISKKISDRSMFWGLFWKGKKSPPYNQRNMVSLLLLPCHLPLCIQHYQTKKGQIKPTTKLITDFFCTFIITYSRLSLSRSRRDLLKHFEISILRHIRCAVLRKIPMEQPNFTNEHVIWLL